MKSAAGFVSGTVDVSTVAEGACASPELRVGFSFATFPSGRLERMPPRKEPKAEQASRGRTCRPAVRGEAALTSWNRSGRD